MQCYPNRYGTKLMNIAPSAQLAVTTNGTPYRVLPDESDNQPNSSQDYKLVTYLNVTGGTSPTAQVFLQGSVDGVNWMDLVPGTSRTAVGAYVEVLDPPNIGILPWIRARVVLGGTAVPTFDAQVELVGTGSFQLSST